jgi:predicted secreted protein
MKRNGVRAASARLAASFFCILGLVGVAQAGDRAAFNSLGYGAETRTFAYEEYGVRDGSGLAYSTITIVDLEQDRWVEGSPYRVAAPEDGPETPLAKVRQQALAKAQPKLTELKIGEPAEILALLGDGVPDADGKTMLFAPPVCCGPGDVADERTTLRLQAFPAKSREDYCTGEHPMAFNLELSDGTTTTEIHRDAEAVPQSRGCPLDYRLYAVLQPLGASGGRLAVISLYQLGFEGPDRRFLVVPVPQ